MKTVFSGIQPSGELHLGNYLGAVRNWVTMQETHRVFLCVVDYHAITQTYDHKKLPQLTREMLLDLVACGVDPEKCVLFVQSHVPEHTELCWVLNTVTQFGDLSRMTQFKDKSARQEDNINVGLFDYPVLQAADILLYKAQLVPVGADQVQHIEITRRIARSFNTRWKKVFPEPEPALTSTPKILGLDGQAKMSKSLGNTISLGASDKDIKKSLARAATDPARVQRTDPGDPDKCNVYTLHTFFTPREQQEWVRTGCTTAGIGCVDCKGALADNVIAHLTPIRTRRAELQDRPGELDAIAERGRARAAEVAQKTMTEVRAAIGLRG